jgi:MFS family permease
VAWTLLGASALLPGSLGATLLVAACASVFALGETLMQPSLPAMVNDMAPDHLRGRYNAVTSVGFQAASVAAPPVAGVMIGNDLGLLWIGVLLCGLLGVVAVSVRWVEPSLTPVANGERAASRAPALPADSSVAPPPAPRTGTAAG